MKDLASPSTPPTLHGLIKNALTRSTLYSDIEKFHPPFRTKATGEDFLSSSFNTVQWHSMPTIETILTC
jgi:hypothetical protein